MWYIDRTEDQLHQENDKQEHQEFQLRATPTVMTEDTTHKAAPKSRNKRLCTFGPRIFNQNKGPHNSNGRDATLNTELLPGTDQVYAHCIQNSPLPNRLSKGKEIEVPEPQNEDEIELEILHQSVTHTQQSPTPEAPGLSPHKASHNRADNTPEPDPASIPACTLGEQENSLISDRHRKGKGIAYDLHISDTGTQVHHKEGPEAYLIENSASTSTQRDGPSCWRRADDASGPSHHHIGYHTLGQDEIDAPREFPDRVTLTHPGRPTGSLLDRYKATAEEAPRPNPKCFILQRLGLTEAEFEKRVTEEVNDLLKESLLERRLAQIFDPSPQAVPRVLTREDCHTLFAATGIPTSGSLLGVYWWMVGLSTARFNFDMEWTPENIELLNAYD